MATFGCFRNGLITVNGVNLSDHCREVTLETSVAELPNDVMGDNTSVVRAGLEDWTITATFLQDFASGSVDATLDTAGGVAHSGFNVIIRADGGAVSTTNPSYSGSAILASYRPIGGAHGVNLESTATFRPAGNLSRTTA